MEFNEIIKYLAENLTIEAECMHTGEFNNQVMQVKLKLNGRTFSKSNCEVMINESKQTR